MDSILYVAEYIKSGKTYSEVRKSYWLRESLIFNVQNEAIDWKKYR